MTIEPTVADFWDGAPGSLWQRPVIAQVIGCSEAKLERDTWMRQGIPIVRLGRHIRYRKSDVEEYLRERTVKMEGRADSLEERSQEWTRERAVKMADHRHRRKAE
jgi:hypothetical protein